MKLYVTAVLKALILSYIISAAALIALAGMMYRLDMGDTRLRVGVIITYIFYVSIGGFYLGRKVKKREFLWGLVVGLLYYSIHIAAVIAAEGVFPDRIAPAAALALLCMGSGMLGGMFG